MDNPIVSWLFETDAVRVCPEGQPFWYTSGKLGPFYINTQFLYGSEAAANALLSVIEEACAGDKLAFYGNRIVMFAPLYLSNYCVNGCVYCPYHRQNGHIPRKKLTQEEIRREGIALQDMGHKRLALEAGEDPVRNTMDYYLECIRTIYSIHHRNGAIRRVNINIAATTVDHYRLLKEAGIGTYILFQETYHKESYLSLHPTGPKHDYNYHTEAMDLSLIHISEPTRH